MVALDWICTLQCESKSVAESPLASVSNLRIQCNIPSEIPKTNVHWFSTSLTCGYLVFNGRDTFLATMPIEIRRVYEDAPTDSGYRVLVDRIWPRGVSKASLDLDEWCRDVAPSNELRKWFGHDPEKWDEFRKRYREELTDHQDDLERLREKAQDRTLILLYSARDTERNQAVVLREVLKE